MKLPTLSNFDFSGKTVAVRVDCDVSIEKGRVVDDTRLAVSIPTLEEVLKRGALKLFILGHRGRPFGYDAKLSTKDLAGYFSEKMGVQVDFWGYNDDFGQLIESVKNTEKKIILFDNLRFWKGETEEHEDFVEKLASLSEVYVNDAFASSHRKHASVYGAAKIHLRNKTACFGQRFVAEVEHLSRVLVDPKRPIVFLLSGVKEDKLKYLDRLVEISDKVLVSGRLPKYLDENYFNPKVIVAKLIMDNEDITIHSMEVFEREIMKAGTIVVSGPMGKFEEEGHRLGTKRVLEAVVNSDAYKIVGGGDTIKAIRILGLMDKFETPRAYDYSDREQSWVSVGGGAMLEFLANGSLPILLEVVN